MPISPNFIGSNLKKSLNEFFQAEDFLDLYTSYIWELDTYDNGFPNILNLERVVGADAKDNQISIKNIISVAKWGKLRNYQRIRSKIVGRDYSEVPLYGEDGKLLKKLALDILNPLIHLRDQVHGIGPTNRSKVLRFALPEEYGAIDTRIVRVFGRGDPDANQRDWLMLLAKTEGIGWSIMDRDRWPQDYQKWLNILRHFAEILNDPNNPHPCPHPPDFIEIGLRKAGIWYCADVEMALFSYASQFT